MDHLSATDAIQPAVQRTREILLHPVVWVRFFLIAILAWAVLPDFPLPSSLTDKLMTPQFSNLNQALNAYKFTPAVKATSITIFVFAAIVLLTLYLSTTFRIPFMLFDLVTGRHTRLRDLWRANGGFALQWFWFCVIVGIIIAIAGGLVSIFVSRTDLKDTGIYLVGKGVVTISGTLLLWLFLDFVVPVLKLEEISVTDAIYTASSLVLTRPLELLSYLVLKTALVLGSTLIFLLFSVLVNRLLLAPIFRGPRCPHYPWRHLPRLTSHSPGCSPDIRTVVGPRPGIADRRPRQHFLRGICRPFLRGTLSSSQFFA